MPEEKSPTSAAPLPEKEPTVPQRVVAAVRHSAFNISAWSVDHPYPVLAFYVGVVALAVLAIGFFMPRRMMPYVESPMVGVVTMMPGLSAEEMEQYVSKPIEEQMVNIKGVRYLRSSSQEGLSIVSLEFPYGDRHEEGALRCAVADERGAGQSPLDRREPETLLGAGSLTR